MQHRYCSVLYIGLFYFTKAWRCAVSCKMNYTTYRGEISSPSTYMGTQQCLYAINLPLGTRIHLEWKKFNFSGNMPDCDLEFIRISRCTNPEKHLIRYCGRLLPNDFYSYDNCIMIEFRSTYDWDYQMGADKKFLLQYKSLNLSTPLYPVRSYPDCFNIHERASENTKNILTPNWPLSYNRYLHGNFCKTTINFHNKWKIRILFMDIDLNVPFRSRQNHTTACEDWRNDVLVITTFRRADSYVRHYHYCAHMPPFSRLFDNWLDRVDITFRTQNSSAHNHTGFALGITLLESTGDEQSGGGYLSHFVVVGIIAAVVISIALLGCFLGALRDYCEYEIKKQCRTDRELTTDQDVNSRLILYVTSV